MIYIIGTGLHSYKDLSLRSIEILKKANKIYFENYTSIQQVPISLLQEYLNKPIIICNRDEIESEDFFFLEASNSLIVILVAGSPMFATTHIGLLIKGKEMNIPVEIIHNASILNVYGCLGLYSYHHGKTVSIPYFTQEWKPRSFFDNILKNIEAGLHTLCLLDIKVEEERFMTVNEALSQILSLENEIVNENYKIFAVCRFGSPNQVIKYDKIKNLIKEDFGKPLHSLVIPGKMDTIEKEMVGELFK
ncbi:diphthine synthase [Vairimorpha necatrix]|uniref:diphthine methyl ester synthase n=1 Tax=Vairimorpha necatrix TaxID=6039 RepID=A0AAX4JGC4_9MICR